MDGENKGKPWKTPMNKWMIWDKKKHYFWFNTHFYVILLGCPRKLGSMVRINGLFHLLINGIYWGEITH